MWWWAVAPFKAYSCILSNCTQHFAISPLLYSPKQWFRMAFSKLGHCFAPIRYALWDFRTLLKPGMPCQTHSADCAVVMVKIIVSRLYGVEIVSRNTHIVIANSHPFIDQLVPTHSSNWVNKRQGKGNIFDKQLWGMLPTLPANYHSLGTHNCVSALFNRAWYLLGQSDACVSSSSICIWFA